VQKTRTVYELNEVFIEKAAALVKAFCFCSSTQIVNFCLNKAGALVLAFLFST